MRPRKGRSYIQGTFKPLNPKKYVGDVKNITYRSGWELRVMSRLDTDPNVTNWASEEVVVPYKDPARDDSWHRYYPDFLVKTRDGKTTMIEVKPAEQQVAPRKGKKRNDRFLAEAATYLTNQAKWAAAREFCKAKGWDFVVMNEMDLGIKRR